MQYYCGGSSKPFKLNFLFYLCEYCIECFNGGRERIMGENVPRLRVSRCFEISVKLFEADKPDWKKVHHERTRTNHSS